MAVILQGAKTIEATPSYARRARVQVRISTGKLGWEYIRHYEQALVLWRAVIYGVMPIQAIHMLAGAGRCGMYRSMCREDCAAYRTYKYRRSPWLVQPQANAGNMFVL